VADIFEFHGILKSLSDQTRYEMVKMLLTRDYCVGGLARRLHISEAAVSQHLKILKQAGLIVGDKHGYFMHYQVDRDRVKAIAQELLGLMELARVNTSECQPHAKDSCALCNHDVSVI
jgi:ArsR family transcriptional regulator, arsenate/arsenite/antimonite-responsive transcriptional repressor